MTRYEINVSKASTIGPAPFRHFCRIALPETMQLDAVTKTLEIAKLFPKSQGYKLDLTKWEEYGHAVRYLDEITQS